jgi:hypothetical protein
MKEKRLCSSTSCHTPRKDSLDVNSSRPPREALFEVLREKL